MLNKLTAFLVLFVVSFGALATGKITSFSLVDADSDQDIRRLKTSETLDIAAEGMALNIRANVSGAVESVKFIVNGKSYRIDNNKVFTVGGDFAKDYFFWLPPLKGATITAIPYSEKAGQGTEGQRLTIHLGVKLNFRTVTYMEGDNFTDINDYGNVIGDQYDRDEYVETPIYADDFFPEVIARASSKFSTAFAINNQGQVVGGTYASGAWLWQDKTRQTIPTASYGPEDALTDINDLGFAVGLEETFDSNDVFIYRNGIKKSVSQNNGRAVFQASINNNNWLAFTERTPSYDFEAVLLNRNHERQSLPIPPNMLSSRAMTLNDRNFVLAELDTGFFERTAIFKGNRHLYPFHESVTTNVESRDMNNAGWVVGNRYLDLDVDYKTEGVLFDGFNEVDIDALTIDKSYEITNISAVNNYGVMVGRADIDHAIMIYPVGLNKLGRLMAVDALTQKTLFEVKDGMKISVSQWPNLTLRADVIGRGSSVVFSVNGETVATESFQPFLIGGMLYSNYLPWNANPGHYTITATPFSKNIGMGNPGKPLTVNVQLIP